MALAFSIIFCIEQQSKKNSLQKKQRRQIEQHLKKQQLYKTKQCRQIEQHLKSNSLFKCVSRSPSNQTAIKKRCFFNCVSGILSAVPN